MIQLKSFNQSKGGTKTGYCLQNVRLGYEIPALYNDAWTAWKNTEQHKNRNIPQLDVPLFYDYTDSDGNRYGHINVQLKDGRIWNDGKLYSNLSAFELAYADIGVKYVGWGESINNVKVIGGTMKVDLATARILGEGVLGRDRDAIHSGKMDADLKKNHVGKELTNAYISTLWNSKESKNGAAKRASNEREAAKVPKLQKEIAELKKQLEEAQNSEFVETKVYVRRAK